MLKNREKQTLIENNNNIKFLLLNNLLNKEHILVYSSYLISEIANHNKYLKISRQEIEKVIIIFVETYIKTYFGSRNTRCEIASIKNVRPYRIEAYTDKKNRIVISKKQIDILQKGKLFEFLRTLFHELTHIKQEYRMQDQCLSYNDLVQLKDKLIATYDYTYLAKNIFNLSTEVESNSYEAQNSIVLMRWMNKAITQEQETIAKKELEKGEKASQNLNRIYNNKEVHLFNIFDEFIKDKPHLLKEYPQLTYEYIEEDGLVRPKTKEELEETYREFLNGTTLFNTTEEELTTYKDFLIERKIQKIKKK